MVHFYNGNKTEDYVTLVDSEVIPPGVKIHNEELTEQPSTHKKPFPRLHRKYALTAIKVLVALALAIIVAVLSFKVRIQGNEIQSLRRLVANEIDGMKEIWVKAGLYGTSLCDFSISNLRYGYLRSRRIGDQKGSACAYACLHMQEIDPEINGVTVFVDPAKKGCWCQRNMTSISKRYKSCFLTSNDSKITADIIDNTAYTCEFKPGDGAGGTEIKIGNQKGNTCINACLHLKKFDNTVNGVTVYRNPNRGGCWCEKGMTRVYSLNWYKTCRLLPRNNSTEQIDARICNFSIGMADGGTKFSMGKRNKHQCVNDCLHMKGIDPSINGVTITPKQGDCWCDQGMKNISGRYKTCFLKRSNAICAENNISYFGNDVRAIGNVESWIKCSESCRGLAECNFWTWVASNQSCYLKSSDNGRAPKSKQISGVRSCGAHMCDFSVGVGVSSSFHKIGEQKGSACVDACSHMKKIEPSINGVTVYTNPTKGGCFCRSNMTHIDGRYRTCLLKPKTVIHALVDDPKPTCKLEPGRGSGVTEIYLGMLMSDVCINACLHLRKIDKRVNGVTVYSNSSRAGCWCEKNMRGRGAWTRTVYKSCIFKYNDTKTTKREFNVTSLCKFSDGSGVGNSRNRGYVGKVNVGECIDSCLYMKRIDPSINGITRDIMSERCWCERDMKSIGEYKTCFLKS